MGQSRPYGGDNKVAKRISSSSPIKINSSKKIQKIEPEVDNTAKCSCCGKVYDKQRGNFLTSNSILFQGNNGFVTICKSCTEKYYQQLIEFYSGNKEHALEHCCQIFDWYFSPDVVAMISRAQQGKSEVSLYPSRMNMIQIKGKGQTYLDTIRDKNTNKIMSAEELPVPKEDKKEEKIIDPEIIKLFGFGYSAEEYDFLADQYGDWTTRYECKTKAQEELFKNLCIAQLTIQRAQLKGSTKEITDSMKTFQDLLGTANLKPSQTNDSALADQNTFGTLIKMWENERPIAEPEEEWKDVDNIHQYIDTFFLGHLANLVHIKNDQEEAYRKEMEKYTVKPPKYVGDEIGETSLLDKFSDKGDRNDTSE